MNRPGPIRSTWALLSGGGSFDEFAARIEVAVDQACSGFVVGRALRAEAARVAAPDRLTVIIDTVLPRWHRLSEIMMRRFHR